MILVQDLIPGSYELLIKDPVTDFNIREIMCLTFEMTYKFETDVAPDPDTDGCDNSQLIPSNLFSAGTTVSTLECVNDVFILTVLLADGGSIPYGGPQASDGSVKIYADHILMPKQRFTSNDITFINPKDSYMRIFAQSEGNDVGTNLLPSCEHKCFQLT